MFGYVWDIIRALPLGLLEHFMGKWCQTIVVLWIKQAQRWTSIACTWLSSALVGRLVMFSLVFRSVSTIKIQPVSFSDRFLAPFLRAH